MAHTARSFARLAALVSLVACGDSLTAPDVRSLRATQLDAIPTATVGTPVTVRVIVTDSNATPVAGQSVDFVVTIGGGHVYAGHANTNGQGIAAEQWTLGKVAGEQVIEARAVDPDGVPLLLGKVHAIAIADSAVTLDRTDVVLWPGERRDLGDALSARDKYGNTAALVTSDAKIAAGSFAIVGDTAIAPDSVGAVGSLTVVVAGQKKTVRIFTAPNFSVKTLTLRSTCPSAGYDSLTQLTVQDPVIVSGDRLSFRWTGRTTTLTYWAAGKVVSASGPTHSSTVNALDMAIRPDTLRSTLETFVRKGADRYNQAVFIAGTTACAKAPYTSDYWVK